MMACGSTWNLEDKASEGIAGDRRSDRRYPILLDLRWRLIRRKRILESGTGRTLDLSRGGIRFESSRPLPEGFNLELAISWPVLLHNVAPMQLVVQGRIVRSESGRIAIQMTQHEFRTVGMPVNHCDAPPRAALPFLAPVNGTRRLAKIQ
jgi:hypothetical protein